MTAPAMLAAKPKLAWPRPRLVHAHRDLFREPAYKDGQPYAKDQSEDDTDT